MNKFSKKQNLIGVLFAFSITFMAFAFFFISTHFLETKSRADSGAMVIADFGSASDPTITKFMVGIHDRSQYLDTDMSMFLGADDSAGTFHTWYPDWTFLTYKSGVDTTTNVGEVNGTYLKIGLVPQYAGGSLETTFNFGAVETERIVKLNVRAYIQLNATETSNTTITFTSLDERGSFIYNTYGNEGKWVDIEIAGANLATIATDETFSGFTMSIKNAQGSGCYTTFKNSWHDFTKAPCYVMIDSVSYEAKAGSYNVTFDYGGKAQNIIQQIKDEPYKATKPNDPVVLGYDFGGWFTNEACTNAYDFNSVVSSNITLYAKWMEVALDEGVLSVMSTNTAAFAKIGATLYDESGNAVSMQDITNDTLDALGNFGPGIGTTFDKIDATALAGSKDGKVLQINSLSPEYWGARNFGTKVLIGKKVNMLETESITIKMYLSLDKSNYGSTKLYLYNFNGIDFVEIDTSVQYQWIDVTLMGEQLAKLCNGGVFEGFILRIYGNPTTTNNGNTSKFTSAYWPECANSIEPLFVAIDEVAYKEKIASVEKTSLTIGADFTLNYFVTFFHSKYEGARMRFTIGNQAPVLVNGVKENGRYKYAFEGICPQDMRDSIVAELVFADEVILTAKEHTVYDYLTALLTKNAVELRLTDKEYTALQTLVADTLYYGGAAQAYTDHNTDNLASENVIVQPTIFVGPQGTVKNLVKHTQVEGVKFVAGGVYFKNKVSLYFKFAAVDPTEITLKVSATGVDKTYRSSDFEAFEDDVYCIYTDGILPVDFGNTFTVQLFHKETLVQTFTYSVNSYVYSFKDKTGNQSAMAELAKCLYNYGVSASNYFTAENYVLSTQREVKASNSVSFDVIGGADVMPIGAWSGPTDTMILGKNDTYTADYYFSQIRDLGINFFPDTISATSENIHTLLNLCDKYGMAVELYYITPQDGLKLTDDLLEEAKLLIKQHPSAVGFRFPDELGMAEINNYKELAAALSEYDRYFNALPDYAEPEWYGGDYEKYIAAFLEFGIKRVSYDYYPFYKDGFRPNGQTYFENLAKMRKVTNAYDATFWAFMQVGTAYDPDCSATYDSEAGMLWNVNTTLAYGAKGIQYFTLSNQGFGEDPTGGTSSAIYNKQLVLNERAEYVKKANKQIKAIDHVLMNSYSDGVIFAGSTPSAGSITLTKPSAAYGTLTSYYELKSVSAAHALVGCFNYNGKTALYVVNNSITQTDNVTLSFDNTYKYQVIQDAQGKYVVGNTLSLSLKAGEGVLVVLE